MLPSCSNAALLVTLLSTASCQSLVHVGDIDTTDDDKPQEILTTKESVDVFIPTHEWQAVKDGQSIPKGLHVRMNLETGLKEAKLMDDPEQLDQKALEQALKNIATSHDEPHSNKQLSESEGGNKKTFRSLEEITSEFASRKIAISSEQEILQQLLANLINSTSTNQLIPILSDVEYYLHSVDNANYFTDIGGVELLVNLLSNTTDREVVAALCLALGSAAHTNPHVSDNLADIGAVDALLKHLEMLAIIDGNVTLRRVIFTLSAISCASANGMRRFIDGGGLALFSSVASKADLPLKVKVKVYTFLSDLLGDSTCNKRLADSGYTIGDIQSGLVETCQEASRILPQIQQPHYLEKLLHFIKVVAGKKMCYTISKDILHSLDNTESKLTRLSEDIMDPEYTRELLDYIISIRELVSSQVSSQTHHEEL